MPPRRKRKLAEDALVKVEEQGEVASVHTVSDDSPPPSPPLPPPPAKRSRGVAAAAAAAAAAAPSTRSHANGNAKQQKKGHPRVDTSSTNGRQTHARASQAEVVTIDDDDIATSPATEPAEDDYDEVKLEEVDIPPSNLHYADEELEMELEEVNVPEAEADEEHSNAYAAAYEAVAAQQGSEEEGESNRVVFKDGKGQPGGITVSLSEPARKAALAARKSGITTKDRQTRLAVHKLMVLCIISHTKRRNMLINDEGLRDQLYSLVPNNYLEKLRAIHPKKVPMQNERVRQFEALLRDLTRWWSFKFRLDPDLSTAAALRQPDSDLYSVAAGKRVDGWIVETAKDREDRHRAERRAEKGKQAETMSKKKGKAKAKDAAEEVASSSSSGFEKKQPFLSEITLFKSELSTTPTFLRLAKPVERIRQPNDLQEQIRRMSGSRESKAQLFTSMCRALGIPARLVVSIQAPSWSVAASKVASTVGAIEGGEKSKVIKRKRAMKAEREQRLHTAQRPDDLMTSEDDGFASTISASGIEHVARGRSSMRGANGTASRPMSVASTASVTSVASPASTRKGATPKGKGREEQDEKDYRDEKWKNGPLEVKYEPRLRIQKAKTLKPGEIAPDSLSDIDPIDITAPPTMWVEVFSKPWQRWITVDPVRGTVEPMGNRHMEPAPSDKSNRLVYVIAFEEDGYARDVTARYTKTLHSRVSRMRPPPVKMSGGEMVDWWSTVVRTIHRPQKLERDAIEDVELEGAASKEPMPSSVAAFKEHPVYTLEKHLKRDEIIFPARQAGTFQGMPVFLQANVVSCRSARQWYNQGRVVKEGEEALKWVKSRGYTIANKRAEEEARMQGQEGLQEGLYAVFQTELYQAPPVQEGIVPTNSFGNIDLFVDTMLPKGAAHVPYSGAVRVAKKLGIHYAEAITGFEFRKHRSMPKLTGVVVAIENEEMLLSAMEQDQYMTAEKEFIKKQERLYKNWKKLLNALKIQERLQREYGERQQADRSSKAGVEVEQLTEGQEGQGEDLEGYRNVALGEEEAMEQPGGGGFMVD